MDSISGTNSVARATLSTMQKTPKNSAGVALNPGGNTPSSVSRSSEPYISMSSGSGSTVAPNLKAAGNSTGAFKFIGHLKMLNKMPPQSQANFLKENFSDLMNNSQNVSQVKDWLSKSVTHSGDSNSSVAGVMREMIQANKATLKKLSQEGSNEKDAVAGFLTEALRSYNFAHHDSAAIKEFVNTFKDLGVPIYGEPEKCMSVASFAGLDYRPGEGVIMQAK